MQITDVICPFCGCLCDDIELIIEDRKILKARRGCAISRDLFLNHDNNLAEPMIDGNVVTVNEAVEEASAILSRSINPLIYGLSSTTNEAVHKAIELAELLGGNIFWGCNPAEAHPRHFVRYSTESKGQFIPNGRKNRSIVVVDIRRTRTAKTTDIFLQISPNRDYACLQVLRAIIKNEIPDCQEVAGIPVGDLVDLAERMKGCKFGVLFFGLGLTMTVGKYLTVAAALALVRDLNKFTKFSVMPMRGHFNVTGADSVLTWESGFPYAVNFSRGYPRYGPGEFSSVDLLARREVDAALIVASDPRANFPSQAARVLTEIPMVAIDPHRSKTTEAAKVVIPTAAAGISAEGTAYRMDGIPIRLRKVVDSQYPSDEDVLGMILERITS